MTLDTDVMFSTALNAFLRQQVVGLLHTRRLHTQRDDCPIQLAMAGGELRRQRPIATGNLL